MNIPESILQILEENQRSSQKFNKIENSILSILNFKDFFENLLTMIGKIFHVPYVWISIIEESCLAQQVQAIHNSELLKSKTGFIPLEKFRKITAGRINSILDNRKIHRFKPLNPSDAGFQIGSIAITPITIDGEIVGSLNQGDINIHRFKPGIDTEFLDRLGLKISICLSNVTAHEQLKYLAFHDSLTGLLNRRIMEKILEREFQRSIRYLTNLSVIFLDLDDFKSINDKFGHDQGDTALIHVANTLLRMKRNTDSVARFAGDEFVVILPSTKVKNAEQYVNRVKIYLRHHPVITGKNKFYIKLSAGIASAIEQNIQSSAALLKKADLKLYQAKNKSL